MTIFTRGRGCASLNEHEQGLWKDLRATLERLEKEQPDERRASLGSTSIVLPAVDGKLYLGPWQRLLLVELEKRANAKGVGPCTDRG